MSRLGSSILSTAVFTGLGAFTYSAWRTHEISKIRVKAEELAANGFIYVDMAKVVTPEEKKEAFDKHLKPHLLKHWEKVEPTLDLDRGEWPMPERGRPLHLTSTKTDVPGMPKIFTGNYTPQAVIAYLFCPRLSVVHFGPQTAFKLKLLLKPLWAAAHAVQAIPGVGPLDKLEEMCRPQHMFQLEAADQVCMYVCMSACLAVWLSPCSPRSLSPSHHPSAITKGLAHHCPPEQEVWNSGAPRPSCCTLRRRRRWSIQAGDTCGLAARPCQVQHTQRPRTESPLGRCGGRGRAACCHLRWHLPCSRRSPSLAW